MLGKSSESRDRVTYSGKPGTVTRVLYTILYDDGETEDVECADYPSEVFINLTYHPSLSNRSSRDLNDRGG